MAQQPASGAPVVTGLAMGSVFWLPDGSGGGMNVVKATSPYDSALPFWVADLTEGTRSSTGATYLHTDTWQEDHSTYPVLEVAILLDRSENGFQFTIHSRAPGGVKNQVSMFPHFEYYDAPMLRASIGYGMEF